MTQRFFYLLAALSVWAWSILSPSTVFSHEFEPGHVERSMDVVVRERRVQISYAIGLADTTMLEWLVREEQLDQQQTQRFRRLIEEHQSSRVEEDTGDQQTGDSQRSSTGAAQGAESAELASESVQPVEFQKELADLFKEKLSEKICGKIQLTYDGQIVEFTEQTLVDTARHHVVLEVRLIGEIPQRKAGVLRLVDENFLEEVESESTGENGVSSEKPADKAQHGSTTRSATDSTEAADLSPSLFRFHGAVRRACRVKGGVVIVNSNVAPVLARANVIDVAQMDRQQRVMSATIEAKLAFVDQEAR